MKPAILTSVIWSVYGCDEPGMRSLVPLVVLAYLVERGEGTMVGMVEALGVSRETMQGVMGALERGGYVSVERGSRGRGGRKRSIYRVKIPMVEDSETTKTT